MGFDTSKLKTMFNNIMAKTADEKEREIASAYLKDVFGKGIPSEHQLHQFNDVVVEQANVLFQQKAASILDIIASYEVREKGDLVQYVIPEQNKAKFVWSAAGTSVEHTRIGGQRTRTLTPTRISTGAYYEIGTLRQGDVDRYNEIVEKVADAKLEFYFTKLNQVLAAGVTAGDIPAANVLDATNITLEQYNKLVGTFARVGGGRPVFVSDVDLIDHFAFQQTSSTVFSKLLYPELQKSLVEDLHVTEIGRSTAVNLVNPFIVGSGNTKTVLPRNVGYMFASGTAKPVKLVEFGDMTQYTTFDSDLEQIQIKIFQDYALDFLQGDMIGYVHDDSITA